MGQGTAGKDVPVVILRKELPGLQLRMLADRDVGVIVWESNFVDDEGRIFGGDTKRFHTAELIHLEEVLSLLKEAVQALTPRRRLDLTRLDPPVPTSREGV